MINNFSLFSGYGGDEFSLNKAGISHKCVGFSETDKYAIQCFKQNHGEIKNYGDCRDINPGSLGNFDLLTGGFPCQSFSRAGNCLGELDTRGTLFNEIIRIAEVKQPRYMLLENVKGLLFKKHKPTFDKILSELDRIGYSVYWKVLNTKDYNIPQSRDRVFFVCFNRYKLFPSENKINFKFPEKEELTLFLKDILEDNIDEKYYLSDGHLKRLLTSSDLEKSFSKIDPEVAGTMTARQYANWKGNYITDKETLERPRHKIVMPILTPDRLVKRQNNFLLKDFKIRKLTPTECFRLQGFLNDEVNLEGISNSQQYKLAGNGQSVNVVKKIFREMFKK